jgi:predicted transcriptional regulator
MKQVMIQLDDATAAQLEKVAPGSSRKRSEFLRGVIARALHEALELGTRKAYEKWPDEAPAVVPADWADEDEAVRLAPKKPRAARPRNKARR